MNRSDVQIRDPFVLPVRSERRYYMYGTCGPGPGYWCYRSIGADLDHWEGPLNVYKPDTSFPGTREWWAPEVHMWQGRYYLFGSFAGDGITRGTGVFVSGSPSGPFQPVTNKAVTPLHWECLDGHLYVDPRRQPWIVFSHEWTQIADGSMIAMRLTPDLSATIGEPFTLFYASSAPRRRQDASQRHFITDGPFIHRLRSGRLLMLWSSFGTGEYMVGMAVANDIRGPWTQLQEPLWSDNGGHAMLFRTFEGQLTLSLHAPNIGDRERPVFTPVIERGDRLVLSPA